MTPKRLFLAVLAAAATVAQIGAAQTADMRGEVALKAVQLAAPEPPETRRAAMQAMGYLIQHKFELFDANGDGPLAPDEWLESHFAAFAVYNQKRDGHLTLHDFTQLLNGPDKEPNTPLLRTRQSQIGRQFRRLDHGGKGYLTIDDFRNEAMASLRLNDVNRDGLVTRQEIDTVAARR